MNKAIEMLVNQIDRNNNHISQMHEYVESYENHIKKASSEIEVLEAENGGLEAAISRLKENV